MGYHEFWTNFLSNSAEKDSYKAPFGASENFPVAYKL